MLAATFHCEKPSGDKIGLDNLLTLGSSHKVGHLMGSTAKHTNVFLSMARTELQSSTHREPERKTCNVAISTLQLKLKVEILPLYNVTYFTTLIRDGCTHM